jgi:hypothetical protein
MLISILNLIYRKFFEERRSWHGEPRGTTTMTELVTGVLAFYSAGVFLAHAYDAYRGGRWT